MRKDLRKTRTMRYFIDAAQEILEVEGMSGLTIRKVADKAGYNSATLYSYFENLEHLTFYASLKYLRNYLIALRDADLPTDALERFLMIWRLFSIESFKNPDYYYNIFYMSQHFKFNDSIRKYFEIYPEELEGLSEDLLPMMLETNIYQRDYESLKSCVKDGHILDKDVSEINDIIVLLFESYLMRVKKEAPLDDLEAHVDTMMRYLEAILSGYVCKAKDSVVQIST